MPAVRLCPMLLVLSLAATAPVATAQFANPGAYTSPAPAGATAGLNLLFFGNSYTISSANPRVNTPSYGGARGVPELVRQIAMAAGHAAPFVKNVYHLNRGMDYHLNPANPSLGHIDEPMLQGETWDAVVLQGFSTRTTDHPYTGSPAKHRTNTWRLFEEVRAGSTNHALQSPAVVPVLYQTWARQPDHWFYDTSSPFTSGNNIAIGLARWTGGPLFDGPEEMAAQVRMNYRRARDEIAVRTPGARPVVAPVGDAWEAADWGRSIGNLYASDHYHANSRGDLLSALTIYGTIYGDTNTVAVIDGGGLQPVLAAIGVSVAEARVLAGFADAVLTTPSIPDLPQLPPTSMLIDVADAIGAVTGAETSPVAGRHYNVLRDPVAGVIANAVDTENRRTGVRIAVVDAFASSTSGGAAGSFIGAVGISGSLWDERAQQDGFFVGQGAGYSDGFARLAVTGLDPARRYDVTFYGSRNSSAYGRVGTYRIGTAEVTLDAEHNLNLIARLEGVAPDAAGALMIEVDNGDLQGNFAYLNVLAITESVRIGGDRAPHPGGTVTLDLAAPAFAGGMFQAMTSFGVGPLAFAGRTLRVSPDALLLLSLSGQAPSVFAGYMGVLDGAGVGAASIHLPPIPGLAGVPLHTAFIVVDGAAPGGIAAVSNTWSAAVLATSAR